jgi:hypothetical protein
MTAEDLQRATGLPRDVVDAYVRGDISPVEITDDVRAELSNVAAALQLPVQMLVTLVRPGPPQDEVELLRLFRGLDTDGRNRILAMARQTANHSR